LLLLWHSTFKVKKCSPSLFLQSVVVSSLQSGKDWQVCAQQREKSHTHTTSAVSRQVYVHALLVQHLQQWFLTGDTPLPKGVSILGGHEPFAPYNMESF